MLGAFSLGAAGTVSETSRFVLSTRPVQDRDLDVDGDGKFSQGDQFIFGDVLMRDGNQVGVSGGVCTATRVTSENDFETQCQVTYDLADGLITTQALPEAADFEGGELHVITGGSGAYENASGTVAIEFADGGAELMFAINLTDQ